MKKIMWVVLFSLVFSLAMSGLALADPGDDKPEVIFSRPKTIIKLDGDLSEWDNAVWYTIDQKTSYMEEGVWDGDADLSAQFAVYYDSEYVYVAAKVVDDEIYNSGYAGSLYTGDCVEFWFDWEMSQALAGYNYYQVNIAPTSSKYDEDFNFLPGYYVYRNPAVQKLVDMMIAAINLTDNGYILEAALPYAAMTASGANKLLGFNVSVVDMDFDGVWTHITWSGTNHSNPSKFVEVTWK
jgi:hypothetical protein